MDVELIAGIAIIASAAAWTIYTLTIAFIASKDRRRA